MQHSRRSPTGTRQANDEEESIAPTPVTDGNQRYHYTTIHSSSSSSSLFNQPRPLTRPPPPESHPVSSNTTLTEPRPRNLAYVFYLTRDSYACACLTLVASLRQVGIHPDIKLVALVTRSVSPDRLKQLERAGIRTDTIKPIRTPITDDMDSTYGLSLTRIAVFGLVEFDRIVVMDVDGAPLWAPRAYWLPQPFFQSTLYVIEPSVALYEAQMAIARTTFRAGAKQKFDMDIANEAFRDTVALLPGTVAVLNGDFRANGASTSGHGHLTVDELAETAYYVHFSESPLGGYGKPWYKNPTHRINHNNDSHPLYSELFETYWAREKEFC
ncbi:hypothetical protein HKX48_003700 [Thoreauomyces humboldtii]|nr:hypothetical protein HKX48_003700 [Thoreauomyces humboldtii]